MSGPDRSLTEIAPASGGQKRSHIQNDSPAGDGPALKRSNMTTTDDAVQIKVLIPTMAVGAIIGKGGEAMRSLKHDSGCKVQMSKNQDIYPGTNERMCLVRGKISSVMKVLEKIAETISDKISKDCPPDQFDHKGIERNKEMKMVVPNTSAGMVIGKAGTRIKEIREATGANIQVYPKQGSQEAKVSQERVVTIAGEPPRVLLDACSRVLEKIAADPLHAANSDLTGIVAGGGPQQMMNNAMMVDNEMQQQGPGGPPVFQHHQQQQAFDPFGRGPAPYGGPPPPQQQQHQQQQQQMQQPPYGGPMPPYAGPPPPAQHSPYVPSQPMAPPPTSGRPSLDQSPYNTTPMKDSFSNGSQSNSGSFKFNPMQGSSNSELLAFLDSLQSTLRTSGFGEQAVAEIMQAMNVLFKYNIMGLGLGLGVAAMAQMRTSAASDRSATKMEPFAYESDRQDSLSRNESLGGVLIDVMSQGNQKNQNFAASVIKERPQMDPGFLELEVPDAIVGAVLGQKAKTLQDIQHFSGAKVHKRSNTASGMRLITLNGDPDHVRAGRVMIEQVINDEQNRRLAQSRSFMSER